MTDDPLWDALRVRADTEVAQAADTRRPSWGPPLLLGLDLLEVTEELGWFGLDDPVVARLWGTFFDPRDRHRPVWAAPETHACTGFRLRMVKRADADSEAKRGKVLVTADKHYRTGEWRIGPDWYPPEHYAPKPWTPREPKAAVSEATLRKRAKQAQELAELDRAYAAERGVTLEAFRAEIAADREAWNQRALQQRQERAAPAMRQAELLIRSRDLGLARIATLVAAAGAFERELAAGSAQLSVCMNCGRALTDPQSVERGVGPDCFDWLQQHFPSRLQALLAAWRHRAERDRQPAAAVAVTAAAQPRR
jgi:hypothetical protein